jgi:uncharacterized small protein (TIGR04563 family)
MARRPERPRTEKLTLYIPQDLWDDIRLEAARQDRSVSWLLAHAWRVALPEMQRIPSAPGSMEPLATDDDL